MNGGEMLESGESDTCRASSIGELGEFAERIWLPMLLAGGNGERLEGVYLRYLAMPILLWKCRDISGAKIVTFLEGLKSRLLPVRERNRILAAFRYLLKCAFKNGVLKQDFSPLIRPYICPGRAMAEKVLPADAVMRALIKLNSTQAIEASAILLFFLTGATIKEILSGRWDGYNEQNGILTLTGRTGRIKHLRLCQHARGILDRMVAWAISDNIFPGANPDIFLKNMETYWHRLSEECGMANMTLQEFKNYYISWQYRNYGYAPSLEECLDTHQ